MNKPISLSIAISEPSLICSDGAAGAERLAMILIVDDNADGAEAMCGLLTAKGYPCHWASEGRLALVMIRSHPPEAPLLVLLDHMMPDISGIDVVRNLRADPATVHVPVIMFSAGFNVAAREQAMILGVRAWLLKGQDMDMTLQVIGVEYERVGGVKSNQR